MDIDSYIARYEPSWKRLEAAVAGGTRSLTRRSGDEIDAAVRLYLQAGAHLSEVRTRYADAGLERYLNHLVARAHAAIYAPRPRTARGLLRVFGSRYRASARRTLPFIGIAATVLIGLTTATSFWVAGSREAQAGLLPPLAEEAIRRAGLQRPRLVESPGLVSTAILVNNVQVAFLSFALGAAVCVGAIYVLARNALLIGALAGTAHSAGSGGVFWALVLPHGFLEITAICIAAGAGLRIGWSIIDPGDRPRGRAVVEEAGDAVLVLVGVVPAFVIAALIEGFLTPSSASAAVTITVGALVAATYIGLIFGPSPRRRIKAGRTL